MSSSDKVAGTVSLNDKFRNFEAREEIGRQVEESIGAPTGGLTKLRRNLRVVFTTIIVSLALTQVAQAQVASQWDLAEHPYRVALFAAVGAVILAGAGVLLFFAARKPGESIIFHLRPAFFFWLGMTYATLLLLLAIVYNVSYGGSAPYLVGGMLPIAVPWFGALGAVTISLEGVFRWSESRWNQEYNYWHLGRPVFGAILGIIGFFLFVLIVSTSGTPPQFLVDPSKATPLKDFIIYYVVAFLAGYREETFRELIRRVTDMILKPAPQSTGVPQVSFRSAGVTLSEIKFTGTAVGSVDRMTIEILNSGDGSLLAPTLAVRGTDPASQRVFDLDNDHVTGIAELGPGGTKTVDITFHPTSAGAYSGALTVAAKNLTAPAEIWVTGAAQ